jgi:hypothetical protein
VSPAAMLVLVHSAVLGVREKTTLRAAFMMQRACPGASARVAAASVAGRYCFRCHCRPDIIGAWSTVPTSRCRSRRCRQYC